MMLGICGITKIQVNIYKRLILNIVSIMKDLVLYYEVLIVPIIIKANVIAKMTA